MYSNYRGNGTGRGDGERSREEEEDSNVISLILTFHSPRYSSGNSVFMFVGSFELKHDFY